ncbi:MAG: hypothetical protein AUK44_07205 [Porphyromonadaceae bacterium CG2_30_38_12]|nr:MAG: hypothetical protein AUK44_07205 [Porphyromonadaceae bacterium CG2_30_38_12]
MERFVTYPLLNKFQQINHFSTTRWGGISTGNYASFNLSPYTGDDPNKQQANLAILCEELQIEAHQLIFPYQTHGDEIRCINLGFNMLSPKAQKLYLHGVDALITNLHAIYIGVTTADCVPILLYDTKNQAIAAIHAGWRGTCARLVQKVLTRMQTEFGTQPEHVVASIGVSISPSAYAVGAELIELFEKANFNTASIFKHRNNSLYLDLWEANKSILQENNIPASQIEIAGICSFTQHEDFFSARKLGLQSGRILSAIELLP